MNLNSYSPWMKKSILTGEFVPKHAWSPLTVRCARCGRACQGSFEKTQAWWAKHETCCRGRR